MAAKYPLDLGRRIRHRGQGPPLGLPDNGRRGYACAGEVLDDTGHQLGAGQVLAPLPQRRGGPRLRLWRASAVEVFHAPEHRAGGHRAPETPLVAGLPLDDECARSFGSRRPATPPSRR